VLIEDTEANLDLAIDRVADRVCAPLFTARGAEACAAMSLATPWVL